MNPLPALRRHSMSDCGQPSANACCLIGAACSVLCEPHPLQKQALTEAHCAGWRGGGMCADCGGAHSVPARPARRDDVVRVVPPSEVPKLGRAGTAASRVVRMPTLVCHAEQPRFERTTSVLASSHGARVRTGDSAQPGAHRVLGGRSGMGRRCALWWRQGVPPAARLLRRLRGGGGGRVPPLCAAFRAASGAHRRTAVPACTDSLTAVTHTRLHSSICAVT